ncbi:hypothetical protein E4U58_007166 [Claviceps cyperi]|nr:hypothetical protein E4U58_007166 [Claviceps cyperi]
MLFSPRFLRVRPRILILSGLVLCIVLWMLLPVSERRPQLLKIEEIEQRYPAAWSHIQQSKKKGGAWYIPPSWLGNHPEPRTILEAAEYASDVAALAPHRQIAYSNIPLIVHQKWNDRNLGRLNEHLLGYIEKWLTYSVSANDTFRQMAYFWWTDEGMAMLVKEKEHHFLQDFQTMFSTVEKVDILRVLVCKWFGGIYGDVDTEPLKHPADWIRKEDTQTWVDSETGKTYGIQEAPATTSERTPVNMLLGLEADTDPDTNQYWRMGYSYPVQLTNWAMASARQHPILYRFMDQLQSKLDIEKQEALQAPTGRRTKGHDPLTSTGPAALTEGTMSWLNKQIGLRWNAVTGLKDGGRAKLASDVLILPMTGFSPGRGKYGNMGSRPYSDPDARLAHHAMGSWHKFDAVVEYGKFCRTVFGMCKNWSKVPSSVHRGRLSFKDRKGKGRAYESDEHFAYWE